MFFAFLAGILLFGVGIFFVSRLVKEKTAEKEQADEEAKKGDS
jgi:hypothetical protein